MHPGYPDRLALLIFLWWCRRWYRMRGDTSQNYPPFKASTNPDLSPRTQTGWTTVLSQSLPEIYRHPHPAHNHPPQTTLLQSSQVHHVHIATHFLRGSRRKLWIYPCLPKTPSHKTGFTFSGKVYEYSQENQCKSLPWASLEGVQRDVLSENAQAEPAPSPVSGNSGGTQPGHDPCRPPGQLTKQTRFTWDGDPMLGCRKSAWKYNAGYPPEGETKIPKPHKGARGRRWGLQSMVFMATGSGSLFFIQ